MYFIYTVYIYISIGILKNAVINSGSLYNELLKNHLTDCVLSRRNIFRSISVTS